MENGKEREALFDNARAVLIFLVVLGHLLADHLSGASRMLGPGILKGLYYAINILHMPAFVFITGYFSKNVEKAREGAVRNFLMPYLVCNTAFALMRYTVEGKFLRLLDVYKIFVPQWGMWFFLACFIWRMLAKDLVRIRYTVPVCLAIGLFLPVLPGLDTTFTIGRVIGFLVFFVAGLNCRPEWIERLKRLPARAGGVVFAVCVALSVWLSAGGWMKQDVLYLKESYENGEKWNYLLMRLVMYLLASVMTLAFLVLMTRKRCFLTEIGQNTLTVYVLHLFVVYLFRKFKFLMGHPSLYLLFALMFAAFLVWGLSRRRVREMYDKALMTVNRICFKEEKEEKKGRV